VNLFKAIKIIYPMRFILSTALVALTATAFAQSDSSKYFLQKGLEEKGKGHLLESYKNFDKAYSYNSKNKEVIANLANSLLELRRYPQAREKFLQLEQMGVTDAATYKQLLQLSFNMRQFPDAIKYANLLKKADPNEKVAYYIGKANYDQENFGEAIKYLDQATKEDATNAEIPYMVARAYSDMQNYKQAVPYFEKAISLAPDNSRWIYEAGLIYYAMNDDKNSLKYLLMAGDKGYKKDNEYMENLATAYLNTGNLEQGIGILKEALQRRPSDMGLLNSIAEAYYDAKKYDDAINSWDQVLTQDKTNAQALYMIGMSYQKKGDKGKGQALCDKAIELDPSLAKYKKKMEMPGM
jgi:tetratricopeptide (TPR) repeat protein